MEDKTFETQFSDIIYANSPQTAVKILLPIIKEFRFQAKQSDEVNKQLGLQLKQMEMDKIQLELDYDKLLMRIKTVTDSTPTTE